MQCTARLFSLALRAVVVVIGVGFAGGCSEDEPSRPQRPPVDGPHTLHSADSGAGGSCAELGGDCSSTDCCEGACQGSVCVARDAVRCAELGGDCSSTDCCEGACQGSVCVAHATCVPLGGDCSERDCCSGSCSGSVCR